jgi:serine protease inhibitor
MPLKSFWSRLRRNESRESGLVLQRDLVAHNSSPASGAAAQPRLTDEPVPTEAPKRTAPTDHTPNAVQAFGMDLLRSECAARPEKNVFISPLSVYLVLAMMENGADGATRIALRKALRIPEDADTETLNTEAKRIVKALNAKEGVELQIANAVWSDRQAPLAAEFVSTCELYFGAAARTLNMSDPTSAALINQWVSEKTRGKITGIVSAEALSATAAMLTNAVYFKGKFLKRFEKELTKEEPFYLANGKTKQVPMMHKAGIASAYRKGKRCEAAALRYQGGEVKGLKRASEIELLVILPEQGTSPAEIFNGDVSALFEQPRRETILDLRLPRFTLDFASSLRRSLAGIGMGIAFEYPGADFARAGSALFYIADVLHKTRLEVDEEGTVAAAATAALMDFASLCPPEPEYKKLVFDRPFALLLRDWTTRATLFTGVVYEP